ncbi:hypothetical protein RQP46_000674 [Phenoliferia psychrophenolica]
MSSLYPNLDLYTTLGVPKTSTALELKQAYRRLALVHHPDKVPQDATAAVIAAANDTFQQVGFAYAVLKDEHRRATYDRTGRTDDGPGEGAKSEAEWKDYFKELWSGEVSATSIAEFTAMYQGSEEETSDILSAYTSSSGSLDAILAAVMCSTIDDQDRFTTLINDAISSGSISSTPTWTKSSKDTKAREKRRAKADKEALEAEAYAKELGVHDKLFGGGATSKGKGKGKGKGKEGGDEDALKALIQGKQAQRLESMLEGLEAKYAPKSKPKAKKGKGKKHAIDDDDDEDEEERPKGKKRAKVDVEPTEEEFERIQKEIDARRAKPVEGATKKKGRK